MGLQLIVKNADFSAIKVGNLGRLTSITTGLLGLFALSDFFGDPTINFSGGDAATIVGAPVQALTGVTSSRYDYIDFGIVPTGSRTVAAVFSNAVTASSVVSAFAPSPLFGEYLVTNGTNVNFESAKWSSPHPTVASAVRDEMVVARIELGIGSSIYVPRTAALNSKADTGEQDWPTPYRTSINATSVANKAQLFAYWNRTLSLGELDTFYTEIQAQLLSFGIATI